MFRMLSLAALAAAVAVPAMAQDAPAPTRSQGEIIFTGFRVEGHVGYSHANVQLFNRDDFPDLAAIDNDAGSDGVMLGVGVGYDVDLAGLVVGAEAGIDWTLGDSRLQVGDVDTEVKLDYGRDIEVGARVGKRIGRNLLLYAKGGYTNLRVNARGTGLIDFDGVGDGGFRASGNLDGWRVGGGAEVALPAGFLGGAAYGKLEYRHSEYDADVSKDEALLALGFRF